MYGGIPNTGGEKINRQINRKFSLFQLQSCQKKVPFSGQRPLHVVQNVGTPFYHHSLPKVVFEHLLIMDFYVTNFLTHPSPHRTSPLNRLIQSLHNNPVIKNFEIDIKPHLITQHITRNNSKTSSLFFFAKGGARGSPKKNTNNCTLVAYSPHHSTNKTIGQFNSPSPHLGGALYNRVALALLVATKTF